MNNQPQPKLPDRDAPSGFNGLTWGEIWDWEERSKESCKKYHEQPCNCDPWD